MEANVSIAIQLSFLVYNAMTLGNYLYSTASQNIKTKHQRNIKRKGSYRKNKEVRTNRRL